MCINCKAAGKRLPLHPDQAERQVDRRRTIARATDELVEDVKLIEKLIASHDRMSERLFNELYYGNWTKPPKPKSRQETPGGMNIEN